MEQISGLMRTRFPVYRYPERDGKRFAKTSLAGLVKMERRSVARKKALKNHPEDVKAEVRKLFGSMAALARKEEVSTSVIRASLYRPQPTGNRLIAKTLGRDLHELWPEWYDASGNRISKTPRNTNSRPRVAECLKGRAA